MRGSPLPVFSRNRHDPLLPCPEHPRLGPSARFSILQEEQKVEKVEKVINHAFFVQLWNSLDKKADIPRLGSRKSSSSRLLLKLLKIVKMHKSLTWDYIALRFKL